MKVGLIPAFDGGIISTGAEVAKLAAATERNGFDSLWVGEHVVLPAIPRTSYPGESGGLPAPSSAPLPDPLDWLAYAAAKTETLLLGTAVLLVPLHRPLVLAKRIATVDRLSGGRLRLGVGVGWNEQEYEAVGVPFARRGARLEDYISAMRVAWREEVPSYCGEFVSYEPVHISPKPHRPAVPILIGGNSELAARRAGRIGDGYFPFERDHARLAELLTIMRRSALDAGRDPTSIEVTSLGSVRAESVARLSELGVARMVVFLTSTQLSAIDDLGKRCRAVVDCLY